MRMEWGMGNWIKKGLDHPTREPLSSSIHFKKFKKKKEKNFFFFLNWKEKKERTTSHRITFAG